MVDRIDIPKGKGNVCVMGDKDDPPKWSREKLDELLKQLDEVNKKIKVEPATPEDVLGTKEDDLRLPIDQPDFAEQLKKELENEVEYEKATKKSYSELLKKFAKLKELYRENGKKDPQWLIKLENDLKSRHR